MKNTKLFNKISAHSLLLLVIVAFSVVYIRYTWIRVEKKENEKILQIARSVAVSLPLDDIKALEVKPSDVENPRYRNLKNILTNVISVNNEARFAYLYTEINDKIFFIVDSEPEDSKDYSPPGQEYTEANTDDKQIFKDGKELITKPDTDRWGTWVSPLIPIKDSVNGKIIAVFGMDFDSNQWNSSLAFEVIESSVLLVLLILVFIFLLIIKSKNDSLKNEISVRKRTDEDIKLKNEQLEKTNAEKDKFFSIIAHDLRSPFTSFLGFTEIMIEDLHSMTTDELQKIAYSLHSSANNLYGLLTNLLEWSKMQRGITQFNPRTIGLAELFVNTLEVFKETARQKEIKIQTQIPENISVFADQPMLETILRNFISNALKFTLRGGKIIVTAKKRDFIGKKRPAISTDNAVEISVKDTGIGMSKEILENLFSLENQTYRKGTDDEPSTGLGLLLCYDFIEKNGGKIWAESEEKKGSTFFFTLKAGL